MGYNGLAVIASVFLFFMEAQKPVELVFKSLESQPTYNFYTHVGGILRECRIVNGSSFELNIDGKWATLTDENLKSLIRIEALAYCSNRIYSV